jgi:hypothetical protein
MKLINKIFKSGFCYAVLVLMFGCSAEVEVEIPEYIAEFDNLSVYQLDQQTDTVHLVQERTFGDSDEIMIGSLGSTAVDNTGQVLIEDKDQHTIHIFHSDGSYETNLGREGKGPGEFSNFQALSLQVNGDELIAYDRSQQKFTIFALDSLSLSTTINMNPQSWSHIDTLNGAIPGPFYSRNDGTILVGFEKMNAPHDRHVMLYQVNREGELISHRILEHENIDIFASEAEGQKIAMKLPFSRKPLMAVSDNDHIFFAWSEDFLIKEYDEDGKYLRAFYYPFENRELSRKQVIDTYSASFARKAVQKAEFPETWPALEEMLIDDQNRLWISTIVNDLDVYQWWVLDADDGSLLTRFTWPRSKQIEVVKNGKLYARETEEETGLEEILRYDIELLRK